MTGDIGEIMIVRFEGKSRVKGNTKKFSRCRSRDNLTKGLYDNKALIRIEHGNEVPARPSSNTNSKENITTGEANGMQMKENNIVCSLEKMVSENLSKVEDNLKKIIAEQVTFAKARGQ